MEFQGRCGLVVRSWLRTCKAPDSEPDSTEDQWCSQSVWRPGQNKFKRTGSVTDASRSGRPKTATDEGSSTQVLASMASSPTKGTRRLSAQMGISRSSGMHNLRTNKWHPYKLRMLQHLTEDDPERRNRVQ
ncbi:hypothetical protein AVEN_34588-1 [Araneus ventricosus]|uniref:Uncharacterized protein n=1 Tax=Araneus ventricosus TaxID=182803 RepID=A0A4Y2B288_ARAVE|nr:hypothetical protein AVEN_34588-1 [Araneus ventricosus]